ncbi:hypothetical protein R3P38DRAFT_3203986 [Favolaschia claudopus]|uniref:Uncharacterized protein n=1 Tax=Favolaschia claudopus TaxID=2862362 RepID=A0AAW0AUA2_9AGAR
MDFIIIIIIIIIITVDHACSVFCLCDWCIFTALNPKWNGCLISCWGCASAGSEPGHSPLTASVGRLVLSGPTVLIRYLMLVKDALPPSWPWTRKAPCPRGRGAILNAVPQDRSAREPGIYVLYLDSESRAHSAKRFRGCLTVK